MLHIKDHLGLPEISYRPEDRSVDQIVWFYRAGEVAIWVRAEPDDLQRPSPAYISVWLHHYMLLLVENEQSLIGKFHIGTDWECPSLGNDVRSDAGLFMQITPSIGFMNLALTDIDNLQWCKTAFSAFSPLIVEGSWKISLEETEDS